MKILFKIIFFGITLALMSQITYCMDWESRNVSQDDQKKAIRLLNKNILDAMVGKNIPHRIVRDLLSISEKHQFSIDELVAILQSGANNNYTYGFIASPRRSSGGRISYTVYENVDGHRDVHIFEIAKIMGTPTPVLGNFLPQQPQE